MLPAELRDRAEIVLQEVVEREVIVPRIEVGLDDRPTVVHAALNLTNDVLWDVRLPRAALVHVAEVVRILAVAAAEKLVLDGIKSTLQQVT